MLSTYRIQLNKDFTLHDLEQLVDYLHRLGIGTLYASPVFEAVPGSSHGYDVLNPHCINPEIGSEAELRALIRKLQAKGIGWLQDIVPNHMAFDPRNPWLFDVLEKGTQSAYASFFDIDWNSDFGEGRLMAPFLGAPPEEAICNGELQLLLQHDRLFLDYYGSAYPLHPRSYANVLAGVTGHQNLGQLLLQHEALLAVEEPHMFGAQWHEWLLQLAALLKEQAERTAVEAAIARINGDKDRLLTLAGEQAYRLCHWQETDGRINYRRFFTVNGLICLNIQDEAVREAHHTGLKPLLEAGLMQGLRIDHIDGLSNPAAYLRALRREVGEDTYIVVEKILEPGERLPRDWPVQGSSGYDFLAQVNNLLTSRSSEEVFTQFYYTLVDDHRSLPQQVRDKKAYILYHNMGGELQNLYNLLLHSGLVTTEDLSQMRTEDLHTVIAEFLVHCPVYRYYGESYPLPAEERAAVQAVLDAVKAGRPDLSPAADLLAQVMLYRPEARDEAYRAAALRFYQRCMQFTGPLMAKGVEDTLMYTFNRFIGRNEVGDSPGAFGITVKEFHKAMGERQQRWPLSLNATSTHDTKRGEDARARLNVLTDLPSEWLRLVEGWMKESRKLREEGGPDLNDEYFIYQTILATLPFGEEPGYGQRLESYLQKALREAKRFSGWAAPGEAYEAAAKRFAARLLEQDSAFRRSLAPFLDKLFDFGILNALVQLVLKCTCPGVPDVYQGCEGWDFSFVDPDNRRPVDYVRRRQQLATLQEEEGQPFFLDVLWQERYGGRIKLWLLQKLLQLRRSHPALFTEGEYRPLAVEGRFRGNVIAFARRHRQRWLLVVLPLHLAALCKKGEDPKAFDWGATSVVLPEDTLPHWEHLLSGKRDRHEGRIALNHLFKGLPLAVLLGEGVANSRGAGLLLHITSLPSAFGIGDLGPEAYRFADFLARAGQTCWQLLPLNPTEAGQGHSPYSALSGMAGNPLLVSPELLAENGLLDESELPGARLPQTGRTLYAEAERTKDELLRKAWARFCEGDHPELEEAFAAFCNTEKAWLDDYCLYRLLKRMHDGKPWYDWAEGLRLRRPAALEKIAGPQAEALRQVAFEQFLFHRQWGRLKAYCNGRGIRLIGDLPIYVSYDSADVWANQSLFRLDEKGRRLGMAGVPPDAFSTDGQLWGMPVYDWEALKESDYAWWIARLQKNRMLFDQVRLDHFRAFATYWEVPAGAETARNGKWVKGPGANFFETIRSTLGELPFIAEDLGDIDAAVLQLRDQFGLAGMKVLQFAFGEDLPRSEYIPHNYRRDCVVYTGTHDNNTTRGWYKIEADEETRLRLQRYLGRELAEDEVPDAFCRLAYGSVANLVVLPLQDVLGLDADARMNLPAQAGDNWAWRLLPGQLTAEAAGRLSGWVRLYNRD